MRVRRALAIAITTPVLLATVGMTGASAAGGPEPTTGGTFGSARELGDDEMTPEEAVAYSFANELFNRFAATRGAKMETKYQDKSGTNQL